MNKYIYKLINEQFNIGNMDLNNNAKINRNIFNKNVVNPYSVYKKMLNEDTVSQYEIEQLNICDSVIKVQSK